MSYFTETLEETMSMLEFRTSSDERNMRDKISGDHALSKMYKSTRDDAVKYGVDVRSMKDKEMHDKAEKYGGDVTKQSRDQVINKSVKIATDAESGKYGSYGRRTVTKANDIVSKKIGESYDPVYADLIAIGAID